MLMCSLLLFASFQPFPYSARRSCWVRCCEARRCCKLFPPCFSVLLTANFPSSFCKKNFWNQHFNPIFNIFLQVAASPARTNSNIPTRQYLDQTIVPILLQVLLLNIAWLLFKFSSIFEKAVIILKKEVENVEKFLHCSRSMWEQWVTIFIMSPLKKYFFF